MMLLLSLEDCATPEDPTESGPPAAPDGKKAQPRREGGVRGGDKIPAGTVLGAVGNTSLTEAGWGAHLHFSVSKDGELVNPAVFLGE